VITVNKNTSPSNSGTDASDPSHLLHYIRAKNFVLAEFLELDASLKLSGNILRVVPQSDTSRDYLSDEQDALSALATEYYGRPITMQMEPIEPDDAQVAAT
jgi:hypothetical protein